MTGVVFDFGNVLYRVDWGAMARSLAGDRAEDFLDAFIGAPIQVQYETGRADLDEVLSTLGRRGFSLTRKRFLDAYLGMFTPVAGMRTILERLAAAHRPLGLLSNTSPEHARLFIEKTPEYNLFRARVYSFEVGHLKPHSEPYAEICKRLHHPGAELAYTDDVEDYARAAAAVGMTGVPFRGAAELAHRLAALGFRELEGSIA